MTKPELRRYRSRLLGLASRLRNEVVSLRDEAIAAPVGISNNPAEQVEVASHEAEERRTRAVLSSEESMLDEVEAAMDRLETGTFGQCEGCGLSITAERLDALPYARYCIKCAPNHESVQK